MMDDGPLIRGFWWAVVVLVALLAAAQTFAGTAFVVASGGNTYMAVQFVSNVTESDNGTVMTFSFPFAGTGYTVLGNFYNPTVGAVTFNGGAITIGYSQSNASPMNFTLTTTARTSAIAGGTFVVTPKAQWSATVVSQASPVSYTFSYAGGTAGAITTSEVPSLSQRSLTFTVTNSGSLAEYGIFQYNSATHTTGNATGLVLFPTWITAGGTHTFTILINSQDPFFYSPDQIDLTKLLGTGSGNNVMFGATPVIGSVTPITYFNGAGITAVPAVVADTTSTDGGVTGGTSVGGTSAGGALAGGSVGGPLTVTAGTVSSSGGGTNGGGGGGASDAGLVNNAAAINTGIAAAATAINSQAATAANNISKGLAAVGAQVAFAVEANGTGSVVTAVNSFGSQAHTDSGALGGKLDTLHNDNVTTQGQLPSSASVTAADTAFAGTPSTGSMTTAGGTEGTTESGLVPSASLPGATPSEADATSIMAITMPAAFGGATIHFDPVTIGISGVLAGFRTALLWLVWVLYGQRVWAILAPYVRGVGTARQAQGNAVAGGTGAQGTALVAAGLISAAVIVGVTALMALLADIGFGSVTGILSAALPWASMPTHVVWLLDQVFPIAAVTLAALGLLVVHASAAKLYLVMVAAVRYIVP